MAEGVGSETFLRSKHIRYLQAILKRKLPEDYVSADPIRITLVYFAANALATLGELPQEEAGLAGEGGALSQAEKAAYIEWIYSCQRGFGFLGGPFLPDGCCSIACPSPADSSQGTGSPSTLTSAANIATTYAALVSLLLLGDDLARVDRGAVVRGIRAMQLSQHCGMGSGSMASSALSAEDDVRFLYSACAACEILQCWQWPEEGSGQGVQVAAAGAASHALKDTLDLDCSLSFLDRVFSGSSRDAGHALSRGGSQHSPALSSSYCAHYEGGAGLQPGEEVHGGSTYCATAALALLLKQKRRKQRTLGLTQECEGQACCAVMPSSAEGAAEKGCSCSKTLPCSSSIFATSSCLPAQSFLSADFLRELFRWLCHRQLALEEDGCKAESKDRGLASAAAAGEASTAAEGEEAVAEEGAVDSSGGMTGRSGKAADTCYSFWVQASMAIARQLTVDFQQPQACLCCTVVERGAAADKEGGSGRGGGGGGGTSLCPCASSPLSAPPAQLVHWQSLLRFICSCQYCPTGGLGKDMFALPDPMHSYYSISGLALALHPGDGGEKGRGVPSLLDDEEEEKGGSKLEEGAAASVSTEGTATAQASFPASATAAVAAVMPDLLKSSEALARGVGQLLPIDPCLALPLPTLTRLQGLQRRHGWR